MIKQYSTEAGLPVGNLPECRDLMLTFSAGEYVIRYREDVHRVVIVRVRHSKEEGS